MDRVQALANEEAKDGYMVTDSLTPRKFAELTDIDIGVSRALYTAYCTANDDYTKALGQLVDLSNIDNCSVPLIEMFKFLYEQRDIYRSKIAASTMKDLEEMYDRLIDGEKQLHSEKYSRMILYLNLPVESEETYDYLTVIKGVVGKYYNESYFVGETAKDKDFSDAFSTDNTLISILTLVFVILVLLLTFKSVALPLLLILVIQGSVWINFSFPTILHNNLYFLAYLIVSAIMMGANIDYAIVISSRYLRLKEEMPYKEAMIEALNQAFPTVVTSGTILATAGMSIGFLSSENTVASIAVCLGRGTLLSMVPGHVRSAADPAAGQTRWWRKLRLQLACIPRRSSCMGPCVSTDTFADISMATSMPRSMAVSTVRSAHRSISEMCRWRSCRHTLHRRRSCTVRRVPMKKHNVRRLLVLVLVVALCLLCRCRLPSPTPRRSTSTLPMTLCS